MNLQRDRKEHKNHDGGLANGGRDSGRICTAVSYAIKAGFYQSNIHIETMFATMEFPKVMYPVIETTT